MLFRLPFNKKILISIIFVGIIVSCSILGFFLIFSGDNNNNISPIFKGGTITQDETWSGNIFVNESIMVPKGVTLAILPGTQINFKPCRDYKSLQYLGFAVVEGTLIANGTSTN